MLHHQLGSTLQRRAQRIEIEASVDLGDRAAFVAECAANRVQAGSQGRLVRAVGPTEVMEADVRHLRDPSDPVPRQGIRSVP